MSSRRKLNEEAVTNELRAGSLFFRRPQEEEGDATPAPEAHAGNAPLARETGQPTLPAATSQAAVDNGRSSVRTTGRVGRILKRHPFEFYQDQLDQLKQISLSEQMAGGRGNMSEMVREAVDAYLTKRRQDDPAEA